MFSLVNKVHLEAITAPRPPPLCFKQSWKLLVPLSLELMVLLVTTEIPLT